MKKVVASSIPTLCSIAIKGVSRADKMKVAAIFVEIAPINRKQPLVAPLLSNIEVRGSSVSVIQLGKGVQDGRFPALEVLKVSDNNLNKRSMKHLIKAISQGKAPNLRVLNWDGLARRERGATNEMLQALSKGTCPSMEVLSFMENHGFDQQSLSFLGRALQACPKLRMVWMDSTMKPHVLLRDLIKLLRAGDMPLLESLSVRLPSLVDSGKLRLIEKKVEELEKVAASRLGSLNLELSTGEKSRGAFAY